MTNKTGSAVGVVTAPECSVLEGSKHAQGQVKVGGIGRIVIGNTLAQLVARGAGIIAGIGTNAILSRHLGPAGFGHYNLAFAYVLLVAGIFANWGLGNIAVRDASQNLDQIEPILASAALLQLLVSSVSYVLLLVLTHILANGAEDVLVAIAGVTLLVMPIDLLALALQVRLQLARAAWVGIAGSFLTLGATAVAVILGADVTTIVAVSTGTTIIRYALILLVLRGRLEWRKVRPDFTRLKPLLSDSWPLAIATTFVTLFLQAPIIFLSKLSTDAQLGYFSAAGKISSQLTIVPLLLMASLYPLFARLFKEDQVALGILLQKSLRYMVVLALPLAIVGLFVGRWFAQVLFGARFTPAGSVLGMLIVQAAILYPTIIVGEVLIAIGRQKVNLWLNLGQCIVVIVGCVLAIPHFGANGSALALVVGTIATAVGSLFVASRYVALDLRAIVGAVFLPGAALTGCLLVLRLFLPLGVVLPLALLTYAILSVGTKAVDRKDVALACSIFKRPSFLVRKSVS